MSSRAADAAAARLRSTAARLAALKERAGRLEAGVPVTASDVAQARAWAEAQRAETYEARQRLHAAHQLAARRQRAAASVLEASGRFERAARLRDAASWHDAVSSLEAEDREDHEDAEDTEYADDRSAEPRSAEKSSDLLDDHESPEGHPASTPIRRMASANQRLRTLVASVASTRATSASGGAADRRQQLWEAMADACGADLWQGWAQATCRVVTGWLPTVDGTAIATYDDQGHNPLATSDDWAESVDEIHVVLGEGPSVTAHRNGVPVIVADLAAERGRWPGFVSGTATSGLTSVWAFPVMIDRAALGVITFYRRSGGTPSRAEWWDTSAATEMAAAALIGDADDILNSLEPTESSYMAVHIATGIVASRMDITTEEAMARLRAYAFGSGLRLRMVAEMVIGGTVPPL